MNPTLRNILAVVAGIVVGSVVNSTIVNLGPSVIPLPEGADVSTIDGVRESMDLFRFVNFIPPFVAHALGTLVGAFLAAKLAASHGFRFALGIGVFFLLGGIAAAVMIGGPAWFIIADLALAYVPMGYLGGVLAGAKGDEVQEDEN